MWNLYLVALESYSRPRLVLPSVSVKLQAQGSPELSPSGRAAVNTPARTAQMPRGDVFSRLAKTFYESLYRESSLDFQERVPREVVAQEGLQNPSAELAFSQGKPEIPP